LPATAAQPAQGGASGTHQLAWLHSTGLPLYHADPRGDRHPDVIVVDRLGEFGVDGLSQLTDLRYRVSRLDEDRVLIRTDSGDYRLLISNHGLQAPGHHAQYLISVAVAEPVVDDRETVQIEVQQGKHCRWF
jgi:hypothetical protein